MSPPKISTIAAQDRPSDTEGLLPGSASADADQRYEISADLVTLGDNSEGAAESVRTARTHIMARHMEDGRRGVAVCAVTTGVGCTFTAANLAVALSQVGVSTLLMDANMREPQMENFIRPERSTAGLKQCLSDPDHRISDFIHHEVLPNLSIMYAGGVADNAQELLAGEAFRRLIERCLRDFEFTVIDTPPANDVADALRISSMIGYSLIVAKAHSSRFNEVSMLAKQLQEDGAEVIGTILNEI